MKIGKVKVLCLLGEAVQEVTDRMPHLILKWQTKSNSEQQLVLISWKLTAEVKDPISNNSICQCFVQFNKICRKLMRKELAQILILHFRNTIIKFQLLLLKVKSLILVLRINLVLQAIWLLIILEMSTLNMLAKFQCIVKVLESLLEQTRFSITSKELNQEVDLLVELWFLAKEFMLLEVLMES